MGAALGTLIISRLLKQGWRKKRAIETFLMTLSLFLFVITFVVPELRGLGGLILSIFSVFMVGLSFVGILVPSLTYLQEKTPGGLRGRVFGNYWFMSTIITVFPVIFSGAITELFGTRFLLFILTGFAISGLLFSKRYGQKMIDKEMIFEKNDDI